MGERGERGNDERRDGTSGINGQVFFWGVGSSWQGRSGVEAFSIDALQSFAFRVRHGMMSFISNVPNRISHSATHTKIYLDLSQ